MRPLFQSDSTRTICFVGEDDLKYAYVVFGEKEMAMVVQLSGGHDAAMEASLWRRLRR